MGCVVLTVIAGFIGDHLGSVEPVVEHRPPRVGGTPRTEGCVDAARTLLHRVPATDLRVGPERQVEWHAGAPDGLQPVRVVGGEPWRSLQ